MAANQQAMMISFCLFVMPGLVPDIHVLNFSALKTWMAGASPAMTKDVNSGSCPPARAA